MADNNAPPALAIHGASALPAVEVDTYNAELKNSAGFVGDRASKRAFTAILEDAREKMRRTSDDPLGEVATEAIGKKTLEKALGSDDLETAGLVHGAIEEFSQEFATVIRRFLRLKAWQDTERIAIGGGFREGRIGELVIGRTSVLLKSEGLKVELTPIRHHPDEAGLIGAAHLAPAWVFSGHSGILAVDVGGTNIRAGIVELEVKKNPTLSDAHVWRSELWRHADDKPKRDAAVDRLIDMLEALVARAAKENFSLAPFLGIGCPGLIQEDGTIRRGGQNLPGNWEAAKFNLVERIRKRLPTIDGHQTAIVIHNDAVVQGLSQLPFMQDVKHWGVLTIGTGLGNARFTNRPQE